MKLPFNSQGFSLSNFPFSWRNLKWFMVV